jgi:lipoprotein-releasing system permease protein
MRYELFIGLRYLMAKRRASVVSIITMISVSGVALGVTALIVVLSVMGGFKKDLMQKILGTKAHIVVRGVELSPIPEPLDVIEQVSQVKGVIGASAYIEHEGMASSPSGLSGVIIRGIMPDRVGQVSSLPTDVQPGGSIDYLYDDKPLTKAMEAQRTKELDDLLERLNRERGEADAMRRDKLEVRPIDPDEPLPPGLGEPSMPSELPGVAELFKEADPREPAEVVVASGPGPQLEEADAIPALPGEETGEMPSMFDDEEGDEPAPRRKVEGVLVGKELAKSLGVGLGDEINVITPNGDMGPMGRMPRSRPFRVVGLFYSGMYEYDANYIYMRFDVAKEFMKAEGATGIELKTEDVERAVKIARGVEALLGEKLEVLDWQQLNSSLFYALKLEKIAMFVVLTFIILVASFSIVAMLIMIVIEKGREIAVLKAIGATDAAIMRTFVIQGTIIGTVGAALGLVMGLVICWLLAVVGFPLNSEVYYISTLPVAVDAEEVVMVVIAAVLISMLATIYPSWQAARLKPVEGLRDE